MFGRQISIRNSGDHYLVSIGLLLLYQKLFNISYAICHRVFFNKFIFVFPIDNGTIFDLCNHNEVVQP